MKLLWCYIEAFRIFLAELHSLKLLCVELLVMIAEQAYNFILFVLCTQSKVTCIHHIDIYVYMDGS